MSANVATSSAHHVRFASTASTRPTKGILKRPSGSANPQGSNNSGVVVPRRVSASKKMPSMEAALERQVSEFLMLCIHKYQLLGVLVLTSLSRS